MSKNFVQNGRTLSLIAPAGGVTAGLGVQIGAGIFAVPQTTVAAGGSFEGDVAGVWDLVAENPAFVAGDLVYWDAANSRVSKTAGALLKIGVAVEVKALNATTARVRLSPN